MRYFYWECLKMWIRWVKPTSSFMAKISFIVTLIGSFAWPITKFGQMPDLSQLISFVILIAGFSSSIIMLFIVAPYMMWKQAAPEVVKEQTLNLKQYVFPYIRSISASPIIDANERYLSLSVFFPTSLVREIEINPSIQLVLNGSTSELLQIGRIKLTWQYVSRLSDLHIPLGEQMLNIAKQSVKDNIPVKVSLKINTDNPQYYWETEEWTALLLTKVN